MNARFNYCLVIITSVISLLFLSTNITANDAHHLNQFYAPLERVTVSLDFNDQDWKLAYQNAKISYILLEWVPADESIDDWTRYFRVIRTTRNRHRSLENFTTAFKHQITHTCQNKDAITFETLEMSENSALVTWEMTGCISDRSMTYDQREISRFVQNDEFIFELAYTTKSDSKDSVYDRWLAALKSAEIHNVTSLEHSTNLTTQLAKIPLEKLYQAFTPGARGSESASLIPTERTGSGKNMETVFDLQTSGLPADHWYATWMIITPGRGLFPLTRGLRVNNKGELVCPEHPTESPDVISVTEKEFPASVHEILSCENQAGKAFADFFDISAIQYQKGLASAIGIQSHDGEHVALAKGYSRPISANSDGCQIELELASTDGRTYILRGEGFTPDHPVSIDWIYSKYESKFQVTAFSDGSFTVPLFHSQKAKGLDKWKASLVVTESSCQPEVSYEWGKNGMSN